MGGLIFLQVASEGIIDVLNEMAASGIFDYLLPFLLIFALVFGILTKTNLFENKAINAIISLAVGLMALQFELVPIFFSEVFPRLGVGLAVILIIVILLGLFFPKEKWVLYTMFGIAAIVTLVVLISTAGWLGWTAGDWWYYNWRTVAVYVGILVLIAVIVGASSPPKNDFKDKASKFFQDMFGGKGTFGH